MPWIPLLLLLLVALAVVSAVVFGVVFRRRRNTPASNPSEQERLDKMLRD